MVTLITDIENIIAEFNKTINNNIYGINYLERLKYHLIDKIKDIPSLMKNNNFEINKNYEHINLNINLEFYKESLTKIKNKINEDQLVINLNGIQTIKIHNFKDSNSSTSITLYKNHGITLPIDTVISESTSKETYLLKILCIKSLGNIEN